MAEIRQYIRDRKGNRIGVLVADSDKSFGWSLCAVKKGDKFDLEKGLLKARARACSPKTANFEKIPVSIHSEVIDFMVRMQRYFKY